MGPIGRMIAVLGRPTNIPMNLPIDELAITHLEEINAALHVLLESEACGLDTIAQVLDDPSEDVLL